MWLNRAADLESRASIRARAIVRPYLSAFQTWHKKSAFLSTQMLSHEALGLDRGELVEQLRDLAGEVERSELAFRAAAAGEAHHNHFLDVEQAFDQLLSSIEAMAPGSVTSRQARSAGVISARP
jgi:hypothetical protein